MNTKENSRAARTAPWVLLAGGVSLYFQLFFPPFTPILLIPDGLTYLMNAMRMLHGEFIYRDFFQFTPPGLESFFFGAFKLFGVRAWIPNASLLILALAGAWLAIAVAKKITTGWSALLPAALFLTFIIRGGLDATHHWFSSVAALAALAVLAEKRTAGRIVASGLLCALASWFTQTTGILVALAFGVFFVWEKRRDHGSGRDLAGRLGRLAGSFVAGTVALDAYFALRAGLARFIHCTVVFGAKYYRADPEWNSLGAYFRYDIIPRSMPWYHLPALGVYLFPPLLLPLIYLLVYARYRQERSRAAEVPWDRVMLINLTGAGMFLGAAPAPTWIHLSAAALPGVILLGWYAGRSGRFERTLRGLLWTGAVLVAVAAPIERQLHWRGEFASPTGKMATLDRDHFEKARWFLKRTRPGEFFFGGGSGFLYFTAGLRNATPLPFITPFEYTRPEQVRAVIEGLEKHRAQFVLWQTDFEPGVDGPAPENNLRPLIAYLKAHYCVVKTFSDSEEVWERVDDFPKTDRPVSVTSGGTTVCIEPGSRR